MEVLEPVRTREGDTPGNTGPFQWLSSLACWSGRPAYKKRSVESLDEQETAAIEALFVAWDTDKSGSLDTAELNRVIQLYNSSSEGVGVENMIMEYDVNEQDGLLDLTEIKHFIVDEANNKKIDVNDVVSRLQELAQMGQHFSLPPGVNKE